MGLWRSFNVRDKTKLWFHTFNIGLIYGFTFKSKEDGITPKKNFGEDFTGNLDHTFESV